MRSLKLAKNISTACLGIVVVSTFFMPASWADNVWFNVSRIVIMLLFLALLLICYGDNSFKNLVVTVKKMPQSVRTLTIVIPLIVLLFIVVQWLWPAFAIDLVRKESWPFYRNAIFVKAAFQLVAAVIFGILIIKFAKQKQVLPAILASLLVLVLIVMAGEELSWGQRIFGWATPENFAGNEQGETNLHNFATQTFQNTLYFGGWLLLIALPFFRESLKKLLGRFKKVAFLGDWLPPTYFLLIFVAAYGLVDSFWSPNGVRFGSVLFSVIATAVILVYSVIRSRGRLAELICLSLGVFIIVLFFNLFVSEIWSLNYGAQTEYLELFINFGIMWWAIDLKHRLSSVRKSDH